MYASCYTCVGRMLPLAGPGNGSPERSPGVATGPASQDAAIPDALLAAISLGQPYGCVPGAAIIEAVCSGLSRWEVTSILVRASLLRHSLGQRGHPQFVVTSLLELEALLHACKELNGQPELPSAAHMAVVSALQGKVWQAAELCTNCQTRYHKPRVTCAILRMRCVCTIPCAGNTAEAGASLQTTSDGPAELQGRALQDDPLHCCKRSNVHGQGTRCFHT
jgi:hypothetical protein